MGIAICLDCGFEACEHIYQRAQAREQRITHLESALKRIANPPIPPPGSGMDLYYKGLQSAAEIAREALK